MAEWFKALDFNSVFLGSNTCSSQELEFFLVILRSTPRSRLEIANRFPLVFHSFSFI